MSETTIIMDGSNPKKENEERTRIASRPEFKNEILNKSKTQKNKISTLKGVGMLVGGVGAAGLAMGFMPSKAEWIKSEEPIILPDEPVMASTVNDNMSYNEAWETAREEVGAGGFFVWKEEPFSTYTNEEWTRLPEDARDDFNENMKVQYNQQHIEEPIETPIIIYDEAPLSDIITDDMSFDDAFALARQDVGAGGVFVWKGKTYNTYYKEEWDAMEKVDQDQFMASADHVVAENNHSTEHLVQSNVNHVPDAIVVDNDGAEVFMSSEIIEVDGQEVQVGYFMSNGEVVVKVDVDNDNQYDYIADPETNQLIGLNGNQDIDINSLEAEEANPVSQPVMSEHIQIEGYDALVTVYSDGTQVAEIDIDGDGVFDSKVSINTDGTFQVLDNNGNVVLEDYIPEEPMPIETPGVYPEPIVDVDYDIDPQFNDDFGNDFNSQGDVSGWMSDDIIT